MTTVQPKQSATAAAAPSRASVERSSSPNAVIPDGGELTYTFTVDQSFRAGSVILDLDVDHPYRPDLVVTLTPPSGRATEVSGREAMPFSDIKATFDLTPALDRQPVKGEWKLTVKDAGSGDRGTLRSWRVRLDEGDPRPDSPELGVANDTSSHSGMVQLTSTKTPDGRYRLLDRTRGQGIETRSGSGADGAAKPIFESNDVWGEKKDRERHRVAVDAQYAAQMTYDYLRDVLARDSLDGHGEKINLDVDTFALLRPLQWNGTSLEVSSTLGGDWASVDMIGRQLARGMVERTGKLQATRGEPWAVGAAMRAILGGVGVEWYAAQKNPELAAHTDPYLIGEQVEGAAFYAPTDFRNPSSDGATIDHYSKYTERDFDQADGIGYNAFYLLTHGGENPTSLHEVKDGIGIEAGLKIFARALFEYMPKDAKYADARAATIAAATDFFGADSIQVQKVKEAWTAVGVLRSTP